MPQMTLKCILLLLISISAMNFVNPNYDWYDIGNLSLMMVEVSCYVSLYIYFEYFIALA